MDSNGVITFDSIFSRDSELDQLNDTIFGAEADGDLIDAVGRNMLFREDGSEILYKDLTNIDEDVIIKNADQVTVSDSDDEGEEPDDEEVAEAEPESKDSSEDEGEEETEEEGESEAALWDEDFDSVVEQNEDVSSDDPNHATSSTSSSSSSSSSNSSTSNPSTSSSSSSSSTSNDNKGTEVSESTTDTTPSLSYRDSDFEFEDQMNMGLPVDMVDCEKSLDAGDPTVGEAPKVDNKLEATIMGYKTSNMMDKLMEGASDSDDLMDSIDSDETSGDEETYGAGSDDIGGDFEDAAPDDASIPDDTGVDANECGDGIPAKEAQVAGTDSATGSGEDDLSVDVIHNEPEEGKDTSVSGTINHSEIPEDPEPLNNLDNNSNDDFDTDEIDDFAEAFDQIANGDKQKNDADVADTSSEIEYDHQDQSNFAGTEQRDKGNTEKFSDNENDGPYKGDGFSGNVMDGDTFEEAFATGETDADLLEAFGNNNANGDRQAGDATVADTSDEVGVDHQDQSNFAGTEERDDSNEETSGKEGMEGEYQVTPFSDPIIDKIDGKVDESVLLNGIGVHNTDYLEEAFDKSSNDDRYDKETADESDFDGQLIPDEIPMPDDYDAEAKKKGAGPKDDGTGEKLNTMAEDAGLQAEHDDGSEGAINAGIEDIDDDPGSEDNEIDDAMIDSLS